MREKKRREREEEGGRREGEEEGGREERKEEGKGWRMRGRCSGSGT